MAANDIMRTLKIFVVEDDPWYGELLKYHLSLNPDFVVHLFTSGSDCIKNMHLSPDAICVDLGLPDMPGNKLIDKIRNIKGTVPIVVISGQEDISVAINIMKTGVFDYIIKNDTAKDLLWNTICRIKENAHLKSEIHELREKLDQKLLFDKNIIGQSPALKKVFSLLDKASGTGINVSISGETGTGKELVALAIHQNSGRKKKPFVAVNMAAIPKDLIESELFGHEKGAFTGANDRKIGKFEEAQGGTIFLDEIAELDLSVQSKILRVLQEREVVRVGGNQKIKLDIRLISATHKNLHEEVRKGHFREDLYYRILGLPVELPPLRERGGDILLLAKHFVKEFCEWNKLKEITISKTAYDKVLSYNFPGNVRELKAIMELACIMSDGVEITENDITYPSHREDREFTAIEKKLNEYIQDIIQFYLKKYNRNVVVVADKLGIGKSTIYNMLKRNEIALN